MMSSQKHERVHLKITDYNDTGEINWVVGYGDEAGDALHTEQSYQ